MPNSVDPSIRRSVDPSTRAKPRVLFLDHAGVLGGAELFLLELAQAFRERGEVILFTDGPFRLRLEQANVPVQVISASKSVTGVGRGGKILAQLRSIPGVWKLSQTVAKYAQKFDVLFANSQKALVIGSLASLLSRKPLVWYLHDIVTADHFSALNRRICVFLGNRFATRIIANSQASLDAFQQAGGRRDRTSVVYNGIDAPAFPHPITDHRSPSTDSYPQSLPTAHRPPATADVPSLRPSDVPSIQPPSTAHRLPSTAPQPPPTAHCPPATADVPSLRPSDVPSIQPPLTDHRSPPTESLARQLRLQLKLQTGTPVIALFSRLAPWKGQTVLLDALALLPGVHALFVGAPLFGDEIRYEQELKAQAQRLGLADRTHFLGFRDDIPALLQVADIVVHTSIAPEPFGRVIVEGMLARKPVVATRAGGACEIIKDGVTGRLVEPGNVKELADVLQSLLSNPEQANALAAAGYEAARTRFSVQAMVEGVQRAIGLAISG